MTRTARQLDAHLEVNVEVKSPRRPRVNRDDLPIFEHKRYRCEECGGLRFKMRSKQDSDGVSTQERTCRDCGFRFWLIVS